MPTGRRRAEVGPLIFKAVRNGRPYPDHGLSTRDWAMIPPRQIRLDTLTTTKSELALELLSRAVRENLPVWLGYVDAQGSGSQRVVQPVSLAGGFLQGYDERRGESRTFAVHRITSAALVEEDDRAASS